MAYLAPSQRLALYRGQRLGTELISILPGSEALGGEISADIDQDLARITTLSRNMKFQYQVAVYLAAASIGGSTPQIELHKAFLQEMINLQASGLKMNDIVWIDDKTLTTVANPLSTKTGPLVDEVIPVTSLAALGSLTSTQDYLYFGSESGRKGFFAKVKAQGADTVTVDIPGPVLDGTIVQEDARVIAAGYTVYTVTFGYHRCRYEGQGLPEVSEGSQDSERFNMVYSFISDRLPNFKGEVV